MVSKVALAMYSVRRWAKTRTTGPDKPYGRDNVTSAERLAARFKGLCRSIGDSALVWQTVRNGFFKNGDVW